MTVDPTAFDFIGFCRAGMTLKTRDRREARILEVAPETGIIRGEVQMMGRCEWRADGRYREAPAGAAGPWDLMPPVAQDASEDTRQRESIAAALRDPDSNPGCCD